MDGDSRRVQAESARHAEARSARVEQRAAVEIGPIVPALAAHAAADGRGAEPCGAHERSAAGSECGEEV